MHFPEERERLVAHRLHAGSQQGVLGANEGMNDGWQCDPGFDLHRHWVYKAPASTRALMFRRLQSSARQTNSLHNSRNFCIFYSRSGGVINRSL